MATWAFLVSLVLSAFVMRIPASGRTPHDFCHDPETTLQLLQSSFKREEASPAPLVLTDAQGSVRPEGTRLSEQYFQDMAEWPDFSDIVGVIQDIAGAGSSAGNVSDAVAGIAEASGSVIVKLVETVADRAATALDVVNKTVSRVASAAAEAQANVMTSWNMSLDQALNLTLQEKLELFETVAQGAMGAIETAWADFSAMATTMTRTLVSTIDLAHFQEVAEVVNKTLTKALDQGDDFARDLVKAGDTVLGLGRAASWKVMLQLRHFRGVLDSAVRHLSTFVHWFKEAFETLAVTVDHRVTELFSEDLAERMNAAVIQVQVKASRVVDGLQGSFVELVDGLRGFTVALETEERPQHAGALRSSAGLACSVTLTVIAVGW